MCTSWHFGQLLNFICLAEGNVYINHCIIIFFTGCKTIKLCCRTTILINCSAAADKSCRRFNFVTLVASIGRLLVQIPAESGGQKASGAAEDSVIEQSSCGGGGGGSQQQPSHRIRPGGVRYKEYIEYILYRYIPCSIIQGSVCIGPITSIQDPLGSVTFGLPGSGSFIFCSGSGSESKTGP